MADVEKDRSWNPKGGYYDVSAHQTDTTFDLAEAGTHSATLGTTALNLLFRNAPTLTFEGLETSMRTMTDPSRVQELGDELAAAIQNS